MVKFLWIFSFLLIQAAHAESESAERFVTELSKTRFYQGEIVSCNFVLYSIEDRVEVEVAKFPEFRGFWSENSALRQGPLLLLPDPRFPGQRRAVVGTYQLTAMMGGNQPKITPMRLVLKNFRQISGPSEKVLLSEMPNLTILPLPKPSAADAPFFTGAVGQFSFRAESPVVRFFPKEPTALRFSLSGLGNFAELNALPIQLPPGVTLVSQRTALVGSGPFQNKAFEIVVTVDSEAAVEFPPVRLAVFDPSLERYDILSTDPIRMEALKRPPEVDQKEALDFGPPEAAWHSAEPLERQTWFLVLQGVLALAWISLGLGAASRFLHARRSADPWVKLKLRWKGLLEQAPPTPEEWLREADTLVFDTISTRAKLSFTTRRQALRFAQSHFGPETSAAVEKLFKTLEETRYSPHPPAPPSKVELAKPLQGLRSALFSRRRR